MIGARVLTDDHEAIGVLDLFQGHGAFADTDGLL